MSLKKSIKNLQREGKTHRQISEALGCSIWTVKYHLNPKRQAKQKAANKAWRDTNVLKQKWMNFHKRTGKRQFSFEDLLSKIGENHTCYLTGEKLDLTNPDSFSLDHIIPVAKGGDSSLENVALCSATVNRAKADLSVKEFKELCQSVVNGSG